MREIFLIARREYLAYVTAWGFWLQIIALPIFGILGGLVGGLAANSDPVRSFAIIETGSEWTQVIDAALVKDIKDQTEDKLDEIALNSGLPEDLAEQAGEAFDAAPDIEAALAAWRNVVGDRLPASLQSALKPAPARFRRVAPPETSIEGLRPFLIGEKTLANGTKEGDKLYAALILNSKPGSIGPEAQYWSANLTNPALRQFLNAALYDGAREKSLSNAGLTRDNITAIGKINTRIKSFNPKRVAEAGNSASQAVTFRDQLPFIVGMIMTYVLWSAVLGVANTLLMGVMEERSNKILDTLLTSASPGQILIGKLAGVAAVSLSLLASWGIMAAGAGMWAASGGAAGIVQSAAETAFNPALLGIFATGFIFGYLMYGSMFLAMGSLCETLQEAQSLMTPILFVMMAPLLVMVFALSNPDLAWIKIMSWIPIFTPFLMLVRAPAGLESWEILGMMALMLVTTGVMLWLAGLVFRAGALRRLNAADLGRFLGVRTKKPASATPES